MSHPAFDIQNWEKVDFSVQSSLSYNNFSTFVGLDIPVAKFYFFLKQKFEPINVNYLAIAHFFPERNVTDNHKNKWCFIFNESQNYIILSGDDKVNIAVLSIEDAPIKLDFDLFCNNINLDLEKFSLAEYNNLGFDIYLNYSFQLRTLITEYKAIVEKKLPPYPSQLSISQKDLKNASPETKYKIIESFNDYNYWLKQMLNKASYSLQIQILMPIYFESLVDLAFRIKLRKSLFNRDKIYVAKGKSYDIFENFEFLNIEQKIKEIKNKCFEVNPKRIDKFLTDLKEDFENGNVKKRKRNKLLHGNALLFRNLNMKFYADDDKIIGFPNNGTRAIAESINASVEETKLIKTIKSYEKQCNDFIDIFDDNGYFKSLVSSIMFAHNSKTGGCISTDISDYEHLYAPQKLD